MSETTNNPLNTVLKVMHKHMEADSNDIYVGILRLVQHCIDETDQNDYETDSDGETIISELNEAVADFEMTQRDDIDDEDPEDQDLDENDDIERETEDLDDDDEPEVKGTIFNQHPTEEAPAT